MLTRLLPASGVHRSIERAVEHGSTGICSLIESAAHRSIHQCCAGDILHTPRTCLLLLLWHAAAAGASKQAHLRCDADCFAEIVSVAAAAQQCAKTAQVAHVSYVAAAHAVAVHVAHAVAVHVAHAVAVHVAHAVAVHVAHAVTVHVAAAAHVIHRTLHDAHAILLHRLLKLWLLKLVLAHAALHNRRLLFA